MEGVTSGLVARGAGLILNSRIKSSPHPVESSMWLGAGPREDSCGLHLLRGKSGRARPSVLSDSAPLHFTPSEVNWLRL